MEQYNYRRFDESGQCWKDDLCEDKKTTIMTILYSSANCFAMVGEMLHPMI